MITFAEAKLLAENTARANFNWLPLKQPYLSETYIEREYCWIFFIHENALVAREGSLCFTAYAVSRKGKVRDVYDFRSDAQKMSGFADKISDYFFSTVE